MLSPTDQVRDFVYTTRPEGSPRSERCGARLDLVLDRAGFSPVYPRPIAHGGAMLADLDGA